MLDVSGAFVVRLATYLRNVILKTIYELWFFVGVAIGCFYKQKRAYEI